MYLKICKIKAMSLEIKKHNNNLQRLLNKLDSNYLQKLESN